MKDIFDEIDRWIDDLFNNSHAPREDNSGLVEYNGVSYFIYDDKVALTFPMIGVEKNDISFKVERDKIKLKFIYEDKLHEAEIPTLKYVIPGTEKWSFTNEIFDIEIKRELENGRDTIRKNSGTTETNDTA